MRVTDVWQYLSLLLTTVFQTLCCWCGYDASDLEVLTVKMRDLRELFQWSECEPLYLYTVRKLNPHQTRWALGLARCYWCSYNMLPLSERVMDTDSLLTWRWEGFQNFSLGFTSLGIQVLWAPLSCKTEARTPPNFAAVGHSLSYKWALGFPNRVQPHWSSLVSSPQGDNLGFT